MSKLEDQKLQYVKDNLIEFDKAEIRKELIEGKNLIKAAKELYERLINNYKYYRLMSDGYKMFYSEEYLNNHSVSEIEAEFIKMN